MLHFSVPILRKKRISSPIFKKGRERGEGRVPPTPCIWGTIFRGCLLSLVVVLTLKASNPSSSNDFSLPMVCGKQQQRKFELIRWCTNPSPGGELVRWMTKEKLEGNKKIKFLLHPPEDNSGQIISNSVSVWLFALHAKAMSIRNNQRIFSLLSMICYLFQPSPFCHFERFKHPSSFITLICPVCCSILFLFVYLVAVFRLTFACFGRLLL